MKLYSDGKIFQHIVLNYLELTNITTSMLGPANLLVQVHSLKKFCVHLCFAVLHPEKISVKLWFPLKYCNHSQNGTSHSKSLCTSYNVL